MDILTEICKLTNTHEKDWIQTNIRPPVYRYDGRGMISTVAIKALDKAGYLYYISGASRKFVVY